LRQWILFHIASGQSFFTGAACLLAAIGLSPVARRAWARTSRNLLAGLGGILIAISGTPLPPPLYLLLSLASLAWIWGESRRERLSPRLVWSIRGVAVLAVLVGVLLELPYHLLPRIPALGRPVLGIIGDSVTAGMGGPRGATWPSEFARR